MSSKLRGRTAVCLIAGPILVVASGIVALASGVGSLAWITSDTPPAYDPADDPYATVGFSATAERIPRFTAVARPLWSLAYRDFANGPKTVDEVLDVLLRRRMGLDRAEKRAVAEAIVEQSREHDLAPAFVLAVIEIESSFRPTVRSSADAVGLMQVQPETGQWIAARCGMPWRGEETLLDPVTNVRLGTHYLAELRKRFGRWDHALAAYNVGPTRIRAMINGGEAVPAGYAGRILGNAPTVLPGF